MFQQYRCEGIHSQKPIIAVPTESIITAWFMYNFREGKKNNAINQNSFSITDYSDDFLDLESQIKKKFKMRCIYKYIVKCYNTKLLVVNNKKTNMQNMKSTYNIYRNLCYNKNFYPKAENIISTHNINQVFDQGLIYTGSKIWITRHQNAMSISEYTPKDFTKQFTSNCLLSKQILKRKTSHNNQPIVQSDHDIHCNIYIHSSQDNVLIQSIDIELTIESIAVAYLLYYHNFKLPIAITGNCFENYFNLQHCFKDILYCKNLIRKHIKKEIRNVIKPFNVEILYVDNKRTMIQNFQSILNIFCNLCIHKNFFCMISNLCSDLNICNDFKKHFEHLPIHFKHHLTSQQQCFDAKDLNIRMTITSPNTEIKPPIINSEINRLKIDIMNVNKCCKTIMLNNYNGYHIEVDINWNSLRKGCVDLLSRIADGCLANSNNGLPSFMPTLSKNDQLTFQQRTNRINNSFTFMQLFLTNRRYKYNIMKQPVLWRFLFNNVNQLIIHNNHNHPLFDIYIDLIIIMIKHTMSAWTYEHIMYIDKINIFEHLCIMFKDKYAYSHKKTCHYGREHIKQIYQIIVAMTKSFYMLSKDVFTDTKSLCKYKAYYITKFENVTKRHWTIQFSDTQHDANKMQSLICEQQLNQYQRDINQFLKKGSKYIQFKKDQSIKICRNAKCDKNNIDNRGLDLQICSGCKTVYYCNRECQKYDWNKFHRFHCHLMSVHLRL